MQLGGIIGSAIGSLAAFSDDDDIIKISLESKDIEKIVTTALATIWALSNSGYGRGRGVSDDEIMEIETSIENLQSKNIIYDWHGLSKQRLIEHSNHILTLLEEKEEIN
ncbi:hypothetical protein [Nostoc sp.]|uniref:hypothetical protein n=1 Tax=Nostoc sp. TaxID=1180 RepID=UPI002FF87D0A